MMTKEITHKKRNEGAKSDSPLVSIVTPVYNGDKYLAECIESVLKQTYSNWEYIILNNCSTDNTLQIVEKYAKKDRRVRIFTNDKFLKQIPNWNEAVGKISPASKYCKVLQADDWLYPECIEKMTARAEEYPSAGLISSFRFLGSEISKIKGSGLSYETKFLSGKEAGRKVLLTPMFLFGSCSTVLYRSDLIREKQSFYDATVIHADTDVCFDILQNADFGFVHQVLSYTRRHAEAGTNFCNFYDTYSLFDLYAITNYGKYFLSPEEYDDLLSHTLSEYHHRLVTLLLYGHGKDVLQYHKKELKKMGLHIDKVKLSKAFLTEAIKVKPLLKWIFRKFKGFSTEEEEESTLKTTIETKKQTTALSQS